MLRTSLVWLVLSAAPTPAADWPHFLGPNFDASSPEPGPAEPPKGGLRKLWDAPLGLGYAPVAVAAGKVYHADRFGDATRLTCRDAATGKELWRYETATDYEDFYGYDPGPRAGPVVDGDRAFVYGPDGVLAAVATADGKELWKVDTKAKYRVHQNFFGVGSAPFVFGDLLLAAVGGSPPGPRPDDFGKVAPNGTCVVAFDKKTGDQRYAVGDDLASYSGPVVADVGGRRTGLYLARGGLLGFDPAGGKALFRFPWRARILESVNASNPVVLGDRVLVTEAYDKGSAVLRVTAAGAQPVWTDAAKGRGEKALGGHWCTPVAVGKFVYGCSGRNTSDADLRCVDPATGDVRWVERRTTRCTLVGLAGGRLLGLGEYGELRLLTADPDRYAEAWRWRSPDLEYPAWAPPAVSDGRLYVRGRRRLACYAFGPGR